jgi:folate-binding protein YgfZ
MSSSETSSFDREYDALKMGRAVVALTDWSSISVTGADRQRFLNSFCTNDVKRLVPGSSCEAFITNVKGKIVGHGLLHCCEAEIVFFGVPNQAPRLVAHLDRYIIREDVQLRDTTGERSYLLIAGEVPTEKRNASMSWDIIGRDESKLFDFDPSEVTDIIQSLNTQGFVTVGPAAFEAARIEAGMPWYGVDFNEENLPQEVGRDSQAISFTKGCYLGQETVARIDALGHVNQRLSGVRFRGGDAPAIGTELTRDGRIVGSITSVALSPKLHSPISLAMVRREANSPGTRLESAVGHCEVVALPIT